MESNNMINPNNTQIQIQSEKEKKEFREKLSHDLKEPIKSKHDIPYKRTYLFYDVPGTIPYN